MNEQNFDYRDYVRDEAFLSGYNAYQAKYASQIRESDKVLIALVEKIVAKVQKEKRRLRLLDIGCSTGNLLLHLKNTVPGINLVGGDLAESSLAICQSNPDLKGITFSKLDILALPGEPHFDIITVNAVLYMMADIQFEQALNSIRQALRIGGTMLVFDFFHPFEQNLTIMEVSKTHPEGLRLCFRPISAVRTLLSKMGYGDPEFRPFTLPIDLPRNEDDSELITYTINTSDSRRLPFRGALFQPWCHLSAGRVS